jgi:ferredoxin-NADP reductase
VPLSQHRPSWLPLIVAAIVVSLSAYGIDAQAEGGHESHHPNASAPTTPAAPNSMGAPPATGMPGMGGMGEMGGASPGSMGQGGMGQGEMGGASSGGMGEMGGMMGGRPRKEFYPSLMDMPSLSAEQRQRIESQARAALNTATEDIASAEATLRQANARADSAGAEQATSRLRDALNQAKSAATTLRALSEGKPPQQIALDWFRTQLNLPALTGSNDAGLGLSWFHVVTMAVLATFTVAMILVYVLRLRRANALVQRLTSAPALAAASGRVATPAPPSAPPPTTLPPAAPPPAASAGTPPSTRAGEAAPSSSAGAAASPAAAPSPWKGKLQVAGIFRETKDVKTFRLKNPDGGPIPFTFVPGQFLTYTAEIDGKLVRRSYTIASSAAQTAYVETTIKREEPGIFSDYMHDKVKQGDLIEIAAPFGAFTFRGQEADSVVLIGGGVGITPLMAAIRYLFDTAWRGDIFLVYGVQTTEHFIFRDELEYLQRRMPNLHVIATMARAEGTSWMGPQGHVTKELLTQSVPDIIKRRIHLCGPPGMMEAMKKLLATVGVPTEQVKTEAFGPARGAVPPPGVTQVVPAEPVAAAGVPPAAPAIGPATATIRFAKADKVVALPPDKTVLEVAESNGVSIDYACRVGVCGTCKTKLLEGQVTMEVDDALTPEDKSNNIILACQAKSVGNLVVEA